MFCPCYGRNSCWKFNTDFLSDDLFIYPNLFWSQWSITREHLTWWDTGNLKIKQICQQKIAWLSLSTRKQVWINKSLKLSKVLIKDLLLRNTHYTVNAKRFFYIISKVLLECQSLQIQILSRSFFALRKNSSVHVALFLIVNEWWCNTIQILQIYLKLPHIYLPHITTYLPQCISYLPHFEVEKLPQTWSKIIFCTSLW